MTIGWLKIRNTSGLFSESLCFSIIVPFRNESKNISACLNSLEQLNYPIDNYEVIFIDDQSEDDSLNIVKDWLNKQSANHSVSSLNGEGSKKAAITSGISKAKFDNIITLDADSEVHENWLQSICWHKNEFPDKELFVGPVIYKQKNSLFSNVLALDFVSLIGSGASFISNEKSIMCNGTNLIYTKSLFNKLGGFDSDHNLASGDDLQIMLKVKAENPASIYFVKSTDAIVKTNPPANLREYKEQRIRWATKLKFYSDQDIKLTGLIITSVYFCLCASLITAVLAPKLWIIFAIPFVVKCIIDFLFLFLVASFFERRGLLLYLIPAELFIFVYNLRIAVSILFVSKYNWKNREVS